jgi:hypothetical protein
MTRVWDIVEGVFSTNDCITRPRISNRRPVPEVSSMRQLAVIASLATALAAGPTMMISPATRAQGISEVRVVLQRSPITLRRPLARETREGVDFVRGRSSEKLANSFKAYFKPSTHIDDSSDEGFVFD